VTAPRRVPLDFPPRPHEATIGRGLLGTIGESAASALPDGAARGVCAVVTDDHVAAAGHAAAVAASLRAAGFDPVVETLPAGEAAKSLDVAGRLWTSFAAARLDRGSIVVAVGGGAVIDVAGFAASAWMRGVPWIAVPTTLLAMADASVGGKTAVNLHAGKNLVGSIHMPSAVVMDLTTLATLPPRELRSGLGEILKCAVLAERGRIAALRSGAAALLASSGPAGDESLADTVEFAVRVKADHVRDDATETRGVRALLNLGHTTAHALEAEAGYGTMLHGEAVAIGLVVAARISVRRGLCEPSLEPDLVAAAEAFGLPTLLPSSIDPSRIVERARIDKKHTASRRRMVLPARDRGAVLSDVPDDELRAAL
jgi:3-dehydroquinate synthase